MGKSHRPQRLAEEIKKIIGDMLLRGRLKDPRFSGMIAVSAVEVSGDGISEKDMLKQMAADFHLSDREEEIFMMLAQGRSRQAIANTLFISEGTVKSHVSNIYRKFGVTGKDNLLAKVEELKSR